MNDGALAICVALFVAAALYVRLADPNPYRAGLAVYGAWFFSFLVLELAAVWDRVRWNTLSWTSWQMQSHSSIFSIAFLAGLLVLVVHVVFRWPNRDRFQPPQRDETRG